MASVKKLILLLKNENKDIPLKQLEQRIMRAKRKYPNAEIVIRINSPQ